MGWRTASFIVLAGYGLAMFFIARANPIHGAKIACLMQGIGYLVLVFALGFGRADLARVTRLSFLLGTAAAVLLCSCTFLMFRAIAAHPDRAGVINVITEGWPLITALLLQLAGKPLSPREWVGAFTVAVGMVLLSWPKQ